MTITNTGTIEARVPSRGEMISGKTFEKERVREPVIIEYRESDNPLEWGFTYNEEGGVLLVEHSVQHDSPPEDNR